MHLELHACDTLPRLAWVAEIRRNEETVRVTHGPWVETRHDRFFEGAWDGAFQEGAFDDAVTFLGSGGRLDGGRILFAGTTHKMERLYSVLTGDTLYISNSLVLLLTRAGEDIDLAYPNYFFDYLNYFRAGIRIKNKPIRLRGGNRAFLHDCCNLAVNKNLAIERIEKRITPPPSRYEDYADFLDRTAREVSDNAMDPARKQVFLPIVAISRGYDSVAIAALASRANCRRAVTFRHSGKNHTEDSGTRIAAQLGMEVEEFDRIDYTKLPGLPEVEFYPYTELSAKAMTVFGDRLTGSLYFNGQAGEDYWNKSWEVGSPLLAEPTAFTMSGSNVTEFRLRAGTIVFPLAACGAIHAPAIARIGSSPEMKNWSIGGEYDRPIPRRLAEERGVSRELFGQKKVGGGPQIGKLGLCPESDADFRKFYAEHIRGARSGKHRAGRSSARWYRLPDPIRRFINQTPGVARVLKGIVGDRLDPRWQTMALFTFHWGFYRLKERYEKSLQSCVLHSRR